MIMAPVFLFGGIFMMSFACFSIGLYIFYEWSIRALFILKRLGLWYVFPAFFS